MPLREDDIQCLQSHYLMFTAHYGNLYEQLSAGIWPTDNRQGR
jgi:hypothetical protein